MSRNLIPWTFQTWIENFRDVDLPIGDLARDIAEDPEFPIEDSFAIIHEYICGKAKHPSIIETFVLVWNFYQVSK